MPQAIEAARWAAVELLQRRVIFSPNPFQSAVAEHAIGLVLSPERPITAYLARNASLDARKVVAARERRSRAREIAMPTATGWVDAQPGLEDLVTDPGASSGERAFLWTDAYQKLRHAAASRHRMAGSCLDLWRDGLDEQEAAAQLGVSVGSVKKIKRLIRDTAASLLPIGYRA